MTKRTQQVLFGTIILNLVLLLFFLRLLSIEFVLCAASLVLMLVLPLGRKGGIYHRVVSSAGIFAYAILFLKLIE